MTAHDAWQRLVAGYASASRGRIISLKAKLTRNPSGFRSISAYLNDMRAITDDLALAQCPVSEDDLLVYILTQLGEEYNSIISAVRVREKPLSLGELADVLTDHERQLKDADDSRQLLATANATQRTSSPRNKRQSNFNRNARTNTNNYRANRSTWQQGDTNRPTVTCKFCNFAGHETKVCRKLARFLKEHNVLTTQIPPTAQSAQDLQTGTTLLKGVNNNGVYYGPVASHPTVHTAQLSSLSQWHQQLGHPSNKVLQRCNVPVSMSSLRKFYYSSCNIHKSHKLPFAKNTLVSTKPLQLVYTDVWGPTGKSIDEFYYYLIFVDHFSKYIWLYPMKHNGGEFVKLIPFLNTHGISHFTTPPHTPEHNGVAER
ncbi:PREDICTED: uncharacterized protein LOC109179746 [Ipomoea nil]|uniref:uncharacterized protein LOC109179746 n=1 Tax=Ipomoea nil TaxID=35883 RepID=UPI0009011CA5|nr:PREDICTED: uncharacterized protein LOC109179746 [Ipomoea nil]